MTLSQTRVNLQIDPGAIFARRSISKVALISTPRGPSACGATVIVHDTACPPRRALAFVGRDARAPPWTSLQLSWQPPAVSDHHGRLRYDETDRLRASEAVHDHLETPSAIPLKPASTIAEIRTPSIASGEASPPRGINCASIRVPTEFALPHSADGSVPDRGNHGRDHLLNLRPTRGHQNDDRDSARGEVLLIPEIGIRRDQDIESLELRGIQQIAVLES